MNKAEVKRMSAIRKNMSEMSNYKHFSKSNMLMFLDELMKGFGFILTDGRYSKIIDIRESNE